MATVKRRSRNWLTECRIAYFHVGRWFTIYRALTQSAGTHDNYVRLMVCVIPPLPVAQSPCPARYLPSAVESQPPLSLTPHDRFCETVDTMRGHDGGFWFSIDCTANCYRQLYPARGVKKIDVQYRWKKKRYVYIDAIRIYKLLVLRRSHCFMFYAKTRSLCSISRIVSALKNISNYFKTLSISIKSWITVTYYLLTWTNLYLKKMYVLIHEWRIF